VLCLAPLLLATWIGMTRIVDYYHNYDDVSVGAIIGFSITLLTFHTHVSWLWIAVHPTHESPLSGIGGGSSVAPLPGSHSARRNSGPSGNVHTHFSDNSSPGSRRQVVASSTHMNAHAGRVSVEKEEELESPLLVENKV
jgi:hypothetical protein